jgi:predicted GIY-YIG superfamily endonuclease
MESITLKKRFCSDKCRVYYNRENRSYNGGFIYCLKNPLEDNKIFYIGKTVNSLNKRLKEHINENKNKEKNNIIKLILNAKENVIIEQIEFVDDISILNEREKYWIKQFNEKGLCNIQKGKTNPIGVRFDLDKLNLIQKEQNLKSAQAVLNYLMDNYGKIKPVEKVLSIKPTYYSKKALKPEIKPQNCNVEPPKGLTGIDLTIWKDENWK